MDLQITGNMCSYCTKSINSIYNPYQLTNFNPARAVSRVFNDKNTEDGLCIF